MARQATPNILADMGQGDDALGLAMGPQVMALNIADVRLDGGTQPRAGIDRAVVEDYANDMEANGAEFPPVQVVYDGQAYWLWDGFHRLHARKRNGLYTVPAIVRQGTRRDAVLLSVGANATHGFRRTNEDKRRAVLALLHDEEWAQWSDREIARRCAVSNRFVSDVRQELSVNGSQMPAERRVSRNGTEYTMTTPQRTPAPAVASQDAILERLIKELDAWSDVWEDPSAALKGLQLEAEAGQGDYLDDWSNWTGMPWTKRNLLAALALINLTPDEDDRPENPLWTPPASAKVAPFVPADIEEQVEVEPPVLAQPTREEKMAAALEYDRQRREMQRCAVETFVAYAEDHGYTGILRWLAYRIHDTAQWDDLAHLSRRELWRMIGDKLIGHVMATQDRHTSLERIRAVVDERFGDAGLNGVLWPEDSR